MDSTEPTNSLEVLVERLLQIQPLLRAVHDSVSRHGPEQIHFGVTADLAGEISTLIRSAQRAAEGVIEVEKTAARREMRESLAGEESVLRREFQAEKAVLNAEIEALRSRHAERTAQERAEKAVRAQTLDAANVEGEARFRRADAEAQTRLDAANVEAEARFRRADAEAQTRLDAANVEAEARLRRADAEARTRLEQADSEARSRLQKADDEAKAMLHNVDTEAEARLERAAAKVDERRAKAEARLQQADAEAKARLERAAVEVDEKRARADTEAQAKHDEVEARLSKADAEAKLRLAEAAAEVDRLRTRADAEIQAKRDDSEATWETILAVKRSEAAVIAESRVAAVDAKELAAEAREKAVAVRERTAETMMATMRARLADAEAKVADARARQHAAEGLEKAAEDKDAVAENLLAQARIRFQQSAAEAADMVQSSHAALAESFQQEMVRKKAAADAEAESVRESIVAAQTRRDRELDVREAQLEERSSSIDLEGRLSSIVAQVSQGSRAGEDGEVEAGQSAPQNPRPRFSQWDHILVPLSETLRHIPLTRANASVRSVIFKVAPFLSYPHIADIMMREVDKVLPEPVFSPSWQPHIITGGSCGHCRRPHQCLWFALVDEGGETRYQFRLARDEVQT
ncbi:hypothetical protein HYQ45_013044 [Verticillium longisporum]|uniref:Uncharacterized protein n=1 Tax=Verticillium longisporum TaxID=100787 RepID=A0A8I2ZAY3_VERLO|nr:hypothetical protein HYQ45_013044 [Verticillium longisporum]